MPKSAKIAIAAILGIVAIIVILWDFGLFDSPPKQPPPPTANMTPEQKTEFDKDQQKRQEWEKKQTKPPSGA
jgi:hypothetical protein